MHLISICIRMKICLKIEAVVFQLPKEGTYFTVFHSPLQIRHKLIQILIIFSSMFTFLIQKTRALIKVAVDLNKV